MLRGSSRSGFRGSTPSGSCTSRRVVDEISNTLVLVSGRECIQGAAMERHRRAPGYKRRPLTKNKESMNSAGSGAGRKGEPTHLVGTEGNKTRALDISEIEVK